MTSNRKQLNELKNKIEKLINLHKLLKKENLQLTQDNDKLQQTVKDHQAKIAGLEERSKIQTLGHVISGSDQNTRDVKLKINEYIREIDKCLAMINR